MPFNGFGVFNLLYNWVNDASNSIPITASRMDAQENDMALGFDNCITADGQSTTTAVIPFALGINPIDGIVGTATNDDAAAGYIGEFYSAIKISGSPVTLTTATPANITSLLLTAGDWDVWGSVGFSNSAGSTSLFEAGISTGSAAFPDPDATITAINLLSINSTSSQRLPTGTVRVLLAAPATVYLVARCDFSGGSVNGSGVIQARRPR